MKRREFLTAAAGIALVRPGLATAQEPIELLRVPYLQNTQSNSTSILWASERFGEATVTYAPTGGVSRFADSIGIQDLFFPGMPPYLQYRVDLKGLVPNTEYRYRVMMDGIELASGRFRTAGAGSMKFAFISDSGQGTDAQRVIAQRIASERPAFLLHGGDMAYFSGTQAEFQWNHFNVYGDLMSNLPFFTCPGNHEYLSDARPYLSIHSAPNLSVSAADQGRYYSFDWGNVHFVCLDSNTPLVRAVQGNGEMLRWLEADLVSTRQFWRVAVFHHPPYGGGPNQNDLEVFLVRSHIVPILERHGVQLVLNGHEHSYQRTDGIRHGAVVDRNAGTMYIIAGGGGAALYPTFPHPFQAIARSEHHYLTAEVSGTRMNIRVLRTDGSAIDEFALAPRPSLADEGASRPVSLLPSASSGTLVRILGRSLAAEQRYTVTRPLPTELAGTSVMIDGSLMSLIYVSGSQIWGEVPFPLKFPFGLRVTTPNGMVDTTVVD